MNRNRDLRVAVVGLLAAGEGSVPNIVRRQAELLAGRFAVVLVTGAAPAMEWSGRTVVVRTPGFVWLRRFGHVVREWVASRALVRETLALHASAPIDVAILHSHTLAALGGARLAEAGVGTILVAHADIRKRPRGTYDPWLTRLYRWSNPRGYRRVDRVVALSQEFAEVAGRDLRDPAAVRIIPCPVSGPWPAVPRSRRFTPEHGPMRLGFAGRLAVEKGLPTLLAAVAELRSRGVACRLRLAGEGPMRRALEATARELGLTDCVEFDGWLRDGAVRDLYEAIDLLCLPSISENQGVAAQEALLWGVPVVGTRVGGLVDCIRPGLDGELCDAGSASSLAAALERALANLRDGGYSVPDPEWMERYSPEGHLRAFAGLIDEVTT